MTVYSGRLDQYDTEETVLFDLIDFFFHIDATDVVVTFEDRTKAGLPCKPHYHFVFNCDIKHDPLRRIMSLNENWKGTLSSLKSTDNYDKAMIYILKQYHIQQYVPFSDLDQDNLDHYIELSKRYNETLKINSWQEHVDYFLLSHNFKQDTSREKLISCLLGYVYDWNHNEENKRIDMPTNLKKTLNYIEEKVCSRKEFINRLSMDNGLYIYNEEIYDNRKKNKAKHQMVLEANPNYFDDSENDD